MEKFNYRDLPIIKLDTSDHGADYYWELYKKGTLVDLIVSGPKTARSDLRLIDYIREYLESLESGNISVVDSITYTSIEFKDKPLDHAAQFQLAEQIVDLYMEIYNVACVINYNTSIITFLHDSDKKGYHKQVTISVNATDVEIDSGLVHPNIDKLALHVAKELDGGLYQSDVDLSYKYRVSLPLGIYKIELDKAYLVLPRKSPSAIIDTVELHSGDEVTMYTNLTDALLKYNALKE